MNNFKEPTMLFPYEKLFKEIDLRNNITKNTF